MILLTIKIKNSSKINYNRLKQKNNQINKLVKFMIKKQKFNNLNKVFNKWKINNN